MVWDPYCARKAGDYRVEVLAQRLGPAGAAPRAVLDVAAAASRELAGVELDLSGRGPLVLNFRHEHADEPLKFRIGVHGCAAGELRFFGACLTRVG